MMKHNELLCTVVCMIAMASLAFAWPDLYDNEFKRWAMARRSYDKCQGSGGKCYSTNDCCSSYVCAAFDDIGMTPTDPGWCVHEKELDQCMSKYDCGPNTKCMPLGEQNYCVPVPQNLQEENVVDNQYAKGGIGASCESDSDCRVVAADGKTKLCCQKIRRGRQGTTQRCDVIKPISICIN